MSESPTLSLRVIINKEKNKVIFAKADSHFADILFSFLTLPLGRIFKTLEKYSGDELPTIGSLSNLYRSIANLDIVHFVTDGAKQTLLNPSSSFEDEYKRLKQDITDSPPAEYFNCSKCTSIRSISVYYDNVISCNRCYGSSMSKGEAQKGSGIASAISSDGVFTVHNASFTISDDLQIFPNETGLFEIITRLGITDVHKVEEIKVELGFDEIMKLLKASLTSPTPLSDVILNKTTHANPTRIIPLHEVAVEKNSNSRNLCLTVMIQKSSGKLLYAHAKQDFVDFLFGFFHIPLGGYEHLLAGKTCFRAIDNLYRGISDLADEYYKTSDMKKRLMEPKLVHGCISKDNILPLAEHPLPADYKNAKYSSVKFPKGQGKYVHQGPTTYYITDDLTVTPFCVVSAFSSLTSLNIPISDLQEMELHIGLKEAVNILKASLASTSALTDALLTHSSNKRLKRELQD